MGEKSGALTNVIIAVVALIAILLIVQKAFPELTTQITDSMEGIVTDVTGQWNDDISGS